MAKMKRGTREELVRATIARYGESSREEKSRIAGFHPHGTTRGPDFQAHGTTCFSARRDHPRGVRLRFSGSWDHLIFSPKGPP